MITDISSTAAWRTAIDQAAESGHDLVIVGFGAAGYCGLCFGQLGNATWVAWFKEQVAYAKSKGVESSAYTLMQHNGWGENTPLAEQTLSRDGKTRGPTACFATDYHAKYRQGVLDFINETGMGGERRECGFFLVLLVWVFWVFFIFFFFFLSTAVEAVVVVGSASVGVVLATDVVVV